MAASHSTHSSPSPPSRAHFTLVDPARDDSNSDRGAARVFPLVGDSDSIAEYEICKSMSSSSLSSSSSGGGRLVVRVKDRCDGDGGVNGDDGKVSGEVSSVVAVLVVSPPVLKIRALQPAVVVVPGHLNTSSPSCSPLAWQVMMLDPPSDGCSTYMLLRPGDIIRLGKKSLRVDLTNKPHTDIQVGSSNPIALEDGTAEVANESDRRGNIQVEVNRSIGGQDFFGMDSQLHSSKQPVVAETPASRQKKRDVTKAIKYAPSSEDDSSEMPDSMEERPKFTAGSYNSHKYIAASAAESQELLGSGTVAPRQKQAMKRDFRDSGSHCSLPTGSSGGPLDGTVEAVDETITIPEDVVMENKPKDEASETSEEHFATAQSDKAVGSSIDEEPQAVADDETESGHSENGNLDETTPPPDPSPAPVKKGRKRKSDETMEPITAKSKKRKGKSPGQKFQFTSSEVSRGSRPTTRGRSSSSAKEEADISTGCSLSGSLPHASSATAVGSLKSLRVMFSNSMIPNKPSVMKFLMQHGAKQVENTAKGFDVLVVGPGELKRTSKLLTAVALGKPVVTDEWALESMKVGTLLETTSAEFIPNSLLEESQKHNRRSLFQGKTIFVTPALKREYGSGFSDIESLAKLTGAKKVVSKPLRDTLHDKAKDVAETIYIGREKDDIDALGLLEHGRVCYTKDLISCSILQGVLDLEDGKLKVAVAGHRTKSSSDKKAR